MSAHPVDAAGAPPSRLPDPAPAPRSWIRTLYLYLLALVGVVLLTTGGVRLLDMGLKAWVFTQAEEEERLMMQQPPAPFALERVQRMGQGAAGELTGEERAAVRAWLADYERWQERRERMDPIVSRRQRTAASALAMILVGLPLYLYHWAMIRREARGGP